MQQKISPLAAVAKNDPEAAYKRLQRAVRPWADRANSSFYQLLLKKAADGDWLAAAIIAGIAAEFEASLQSGNVQHYNCRCVIVRSGADNSVTNAKKGGNNG